MTSCLTRIDVVRLVGYVLVGWYFEYGVVTRSYLLRAMVFYRQQPFATVARKLMECLNKYLHSLLCVTWALWPFSMFRWSQSSTQRDFYWTEDINGSIYGIFWPRRRDFDWLPCFVQVTHRCFRLTTLTTLCRSNFNFSKKYNHTQEVNLTVWRKN